MRRQAADEEKKALLDNLRSRRAFRTKKIKRTASVIQRAVSNGLTEVMLGPE